MVIKLPLLNIVNRLKELAELTDKEISAKLVIAIEDCTSAINDISCWTDTTGIEHG